MATTNPVYKVLVTSGDQGLLAAGSRPDALAVGQLGAFNYHTGLSIDGTVLADARDIFLAVGIDPNGVGSIQDINKSAGQTIQVRNAKSLTYKGWTDGRGKIIELAGFTAKCETDYGIKIEFRNQESYALNGYNQFAKTFLIKTGCCSQEDCTSCPEGDCNEIATALMAAINADPDGLATASLFSNTITALISTAPTADGNTVVTIGTTTYTVAVLDADTTAQAAAKILAVINTQTDSPYYATLVGSTLTIHPKTTASADTRTFSVTGSGVAATVSALSTTTVTDLAAFKAAYPGVCVGLRITSNTLAVANYGAINIKYYNPRGTDMIVSAVEGFTCNGTITTTQELAYPDGKGYDIQRLEYIAGGWGKPGPYRVSTLTNLEREGIVYFASKTANYNVFSLTYDQFSVGGWLEYLNNLETIIAVPCADTTTQAAIATVFDRIFTQFGAMAGDVAANDGCTNVATSTLTPATDGIESLA